MRTIFESLVAFIVVTLILGIALSLIRLFNNPIFTLYVKQPGYLTLVIVSISAVVFMSGWIIGAFLMKPK